MDNEENEREVIINPNEISNGDFKKHTCSFMFSTLKQFNLLSEINAKLDLAIASNAATDARVTDLEESVTKIRFDLDSALETKDTEIASLERKVRESDAKMEQLSTTIETMKISQKVQTDDLNKLCRKLSEETLSLERYTRSFNIRMFNLQETPGEKAHDVISKLEQAIHEVTGVAINVEYGHRTGPKRRDGKPRAVICRIASRQQRAVIMAKREEFFKKQLPIYDDLPAADLVEKKKYADIMKEKWSAKKKVRFVRGHWEVDDVVYKGED